jgi:hypothetical protein
MSSLIKRLASEAAEPIERTSAHLLKKGALLVSGLSCLVVSLVFFTVALNAYLTSFAGNEISALVIGGAYLSAALILLLFVGSSSRQAADSGHAMPVPLPIKSASEQIRAAQSSEQNDDFSRQIDGVVAPIHDVLRDAGLERERAALLAGAAIAKELKPLKSMVLALATGVVLGRSLRMRTSR